MSPSVNDNAAMFPETPMDEVRLIITVRGEAATRIKMLADTTGIHKNLIGRDLLIKGMIEKGMLYRGYEHPSAEKRVPKGKNVNEQ